MHKTKLISIIEKFPNKKWAWRIISENRNNITIEYVLEKKKVLNDEFSFIYFFLDYDRDISCKIFSKIQNTNMFYNAISTQKWEIIKIFLHNKLCLNWYTISKSKHITWDIVYKNIDLPWNWDALSSNQNITLDIVRNNIDRKWNFSILSSLDIVKRCPEFSKFIIEKLIENGFNIESYFDAYNIPWDYVIKNKKLNWDWTRLSKRNDIPISFLLQEIELFEWFHISNNPIITLDFIKNNLHLSWYWYAVSMNYNITWDDIINNPNLPWDWNGVSKNPNITWDIVKNNLHNKNWNLEYLSMNPNISCNDISEFYDKNMSQYFHDRDWDWINLSGNRFNYHEYFQSDIYVKKMTKKLHDTIFDELIEVACHPDRIYNCNEYFCSRFQDKYFLECEKYKF